MPAGLGVPFIEALVANLGVGVYAVDVEGRLTFLNAAGAAALGWDRAELTGRDVHHLVHGHRIGGTCPLHDVVRTGEVAEADEDTFVARGGRPVPVGWTSTPMRSDDGRIVGAVVVFRDVTEELEAANRLRREAQRNEVLVHFARELAGQHEVGAIVQEVTDAGVLLTRAAFGAFSYDQVDETGETDTRFALSGVPRETFDRFPLPRATEIFEPDAAGVRTVRFDDVTREPAFRPAGGPAAGHLPVRSYLAVPVLGRRGDVIGGLCFGHPEAGVFTADDERLVEGIAAHAAVAIETAQALGREVEMAVTLQRSLLPTDLPVVSGIRAATRYVPAVVEAEVGGDWYDVIQHPNGTVAAVIGDVAGHSVHAATVMGQVRNALRGYALDGHSPAGVMERVNRFLLTVEPGEIVTCCYIEIDQRMGMATIVSAGHPPPALAVAGRAASIVDLENGPPLGVDLDTRYVETTVLLPAASCLVLYTDGLIERRDLSLDDGIARLLGALGVPAEGSSLDAEVLADAALGAPGETGHADDTAVLVLSVLTAGRDRRQVARRLPSDPASPGVARRFVADVLAEWELAELRDVAQLLVSELVTNAVLHTVSEVELRLRVDDERLRAEVGDQNADRPVRVRQAGDDETSGRGLHLVEALSHAWGVEVQGTGKIVWFELVPAGRSVA